MKRGPLTPKNASKTVKKRVNAPEITTFVEEEAYRLFMQGTPDEVWGHVVRILLHRHGIDELSVRKLLMEFYEQRKQIDKETFFSCLRASQGNPVQLLHACLEGIKKA